ncbi:MAG: acetyltransferase [Patescibacteria group bacterium]
MSTVVIYGSGGHGKVVADVAEKAGLLIEGWIDNTKPFGTEVFGYPVLGDDTNAAEVVQGDRYIVIAIGDNNARRRLADFFSNHHARFVRVKHPSAIIARGAKIAEGVVVCAGVVINADAIIGKHSIINTGAIIEHDCRIGDYAHVASGVSMGGRVVIGDDSLIGTGASIRHDVKIGKGCIVGAGSVVVHDVPDGMVVVGNPAKQLIK